MKIVIACDSYKGCLSSYEVAQYIEKGIFMVDPSMVVSKYAIGDGGEGTVDAFSKITQGLLVETTVFDAYFKKRKIKYCLCDHGKTAMIEVASIIGLTMTPREKRMPMIASSYGVGTALLNALQRGAKRIILGLGGSCTNDGGMGMLQALGARFYDAKGNLLNAQAISLEKIARIDLNHLQRFKGVELIAACDVANHLLGEQGATHVFGKQKGLFPNQIKRLEKGMVNYRNCMLEASGIDFDSFDGGGAAGGIGAAFIGLFHAKMIPGLELICQYCDIEERIADCDLVITGEGQTDRQTRFGKVPMGILNIAKRYDKPVIVLSGAIGLGVQELYSCGFLGIFSIADRAMTFQQALENAPDKLVAASYALVNTIAHFNKQ